MADFPCFRDTDVFDISFSYPIRVVHIDADFDCESSDELVDHVVGEQQEAINSALIGLLRR